MGAGKYLARHFLAVQDMIRRYALQNVPCARGPSNPADRVATRNSGAAPVFTILPRGDYPLEENRFLNPPTLKILPDT